MRDSEKISCQTWREHCYVGKGKTETGRESKRRLNDDLRHDHGIHVNDKRVLRICRARDIHSTIKYNNNKLVRAGMTQSMSRVAHCIDNGPMEGFWGAF